MVAVLLVFFSSAIGRMNRWLGPEGEGLMNAFSAADHDLGVQPMRLSLIHILEDTAIGAYTDATHGMTLSAISMAYYRHICPYGLAKFKRYAVNVWDVEPQGRSDEEVAGEGLDRMETYMKEIGLVTDIKELGVTVDMLDGIADGSFVMDGGYKKLDHDEIVEILAASMR